MNRMMRSMRGQVAGVLFYEQAKRTNGWKHNITKDSVQAVPYRSNPIPVTVDR